MLEKMKKMAKKLKSDNGSTRPMTEEEIEDIKEEIEGEDEDG